MNPKINKALSLFIVFALLIIPQSQIYAQTQTESSTIMLPVVDGVFHHVDLENKMLYVALDKNGEIVQEISFILIESVYLIQGNSERLKEYLKDGSIGGIVGGFSSMFWKDISNKIFRKNGKNQNGEAKNSDRVNLASVAWGVGGGLGAGLLVNYLQNKGEENIRSFPVYNPRTMNFNDISNLKTKLTEKKSFIHVTLKNGREK